MASPAPKSVSADIAAAIAAFEAKKSVEKVPVGAAQNIKKSKYVGKKALKGVSPRLGCVNSVYFS